MLKLRVKMWIITHVVLDNTKQRSCGPVNAFGEKAATAGYPYGFCDNIEVSIPGNIRIITTQYMAEA